MLGRSFGERISAEAFLAVAKNSEMKLLLDLVKYFSPTFFLLY